MSGSGRRGQAADEATDAVAARAHLAMSTGDERTVEALLHPYLHWTDVDGRTVRGRRRVLAMLQQRAVVEPPASVELRDGQIYRWRAGQER